MKQCDTTIAGLLLAHEPHAESVLFRIRLFSRRMDHVFVHYDAKAPAETRRAIASGVAGIPNATLINASIDVHWGGDDMVEAMFALLGEASRQGFGYYAFLSTSHIPLRSRAEYAALASGQDGRSAIDIKPMPARVVAKRLVAPFDKIRRKTTASPVAAIRNLGLLARMKRLYGNPQWGSQWSLIANSDVDAVLAEKEFVAHGKYRSWKILDEVLIPTILAPRLMIENKTFASFARDNRGNPRSLDLGECKSLLNDPGHYWFARKVDDQVARELFTAEGDEREQVS